MIKKPPYSVLVIGENPPDGLLSLLHSYPSIGKVNRVIHPYQMDAFLRNHDVAIIFISVRDWTIHFFETLDKFVSIPKLVIIKGRFDIFDTESLREKGNIFKEPFTGAQLKNICVSLDIRETKEAAIDKYDCLWFLIERKWRRIPCNEIELLQKYPQSQVLICTKALDWVVKSSLSACYQKLPQDRFVRISDQLVVPNSLQNKVHKTKGYPFRGGWVPVIRKLVQFTPEIIETHEA